MRVIIKKEMKSSTGQAVIGVILSIAMSVGGYIAIIHRTSADTDDLKKQDIDTLQRLTRVETESIQYKADVISINSKIDFLLEAQGYTKATIDRLNTKSK